MKKVSFFLGLLFLMNASAAVAATARVRATATEPGNPATTSIADLQKRVESLEKEMAAQKEILNKLQGIDTSSSVARASTSKSISASSSTSSSSALSGIIGVSRPAIKTDIEGVAKGCSEIKTQSRCENSYINGLMGWKVTSDVLLTVGDVNNASMEQACKVGCGTELLAGYKGSLKAGIAANTDKCTILPFYDVETGYALRCAVFESENKISAGSTCVWDGGSCRSAEVICSKDGYCYSI